MGYCGNVRAGKHALTVGPILVGCIFLRAHAFRCRQVQAFGGECAVGWGGNDNAATFTLEAEEVDDATVRSC